MRSKNLQQSFVGFMCFSGVISSRQRLPASCFVTAGLRASCLPTAVARFMFSYSGCPLHVFLQRLPASCFPTAVARFVCNCAMFKVSLSVANRCLSIQSYIEAVSYLEFCLSETIFMISYSGLPLYLILQISKYENKDCGREKFYRDNSKRHVSKKTFFPIDAQKVNVLLIFKGFAKKIKKTSFGRVSTYFYLFLLSSTYNLLITYLSLLNF